jgi:hypothetical protein
MYVIRTYRYNGTEGEYDGPSELTGEIECETEAELLAALEAQPDGNQVISPAAYDMPIGDVIREVNEVNGGELVITIENAR